MKLKRLLSTVMVLSLILSIITAVPLTSEAADGTINPLAEIACNSSTVSEFKNCDVANRIYNTKYGSWVRFDNVDFGKGKNYGTASVTIATPDEYAGGTVSFYLDSMESIPIAQVKIKSTGSWEAYKSQSAEIDEGKIEGIHSLYVTTSALATGDIKSVKFTQYEVEGSVSVPEDIEGSEMETVVKKLVSLGAMSIDASKEFGGETEIGKEELLSSMLTFMHSSLDGIKSDFAEYMGVDVSGMATVDDAARAALFVVGEGLNMKLAGNENYFAKAKSLDILDGVKGGKNDTLTKEQLWRILANLLDVKVMESYSVRDNDGNLLKIEYNGQKSTVSEKYYKMYRSEGVVDGNGETTFAVADGIGDSMIAIGGVKYYTENPTAFELFGQKVEFYYNDDNEIVYITPIDNEILTVDGEDISSFEYGAVKYWEIKEDSKSAKLKSAKLSSDVVFFVNGKVVNNYSSNILDESREVEFIDNNKDGNFEVVFVTKTYDVVVRTVSGSKIYSKFDDKVFDFYTDDLKIVMSSGKVYTDEKIREIPEWSVLTVAESVKANGEISYEMQISKSSAIGPVEAVDNEKMIMKINEKEYTVTDNTIYENNNKVSVGEDVKAYLNVYGEIAAICKVALSNHYGYIIKALYDEDGEDNVLVKIFTEDGELLRLKTADRVTIDGKSYKDQREIKNTINVNGDDGVFAVYTLNSLGDVKKIDLPYNKEKGESPKAGESVDSLHITAQNFNGRHRYVPMSFDGKVFYDDKTKVFTIPYDLTAEKYFRISNKSTFGENGVYTIDAYQVRSDSFVSDVLVRRVDTIGKEDINEGNYVYFFNKLYEVYDTETEEVVTEIEYLKDGKFIRSKIDSEMKATANALNKGDGILIALDLNKTVTYIDKVYDRLTGTYPTETTEWNSGRRNIGGVVDKKYDYHFTLVGGGEVFNSKTNETTIAIYDSKEDELTAGTPADILDSTTGEASKLYMRVYYGIPRSILIVR